MNEIAARRTEIAGRKKILVVDHDRETCDFVEDLLSFRFEILKAASAQEAMDVIGREQPNLVILDLKPADRSGLDVCQTLRETPTTRHLPILVYSGSDDIDHLTEAFDRGADDYVVKTARPRELVARILAKVRRLEENETASEVIACGNLTLDVNKLEACIDDRPLTLSVLEFNLLRFFVVNKDRVMSRAQILEGVWRDAVVSNRTIDTHMVYLRKKLTGFNHVLATVYGAGYILRESPNRRPRPSSREMEPTPLK